MSDSTLELSQKMLAKLPALLPFKHVLQSVLVASKVSETIRKQRTFGVLTKDDFSPVTVADLAVQMAVVNGIRAQFPSDVIIAEEDAASIQDHSICAEIKSILDQYKVPFNRFTDLGTPTEDTKVFWTVDPIDGTKGFLRNGQYAICVALIENSAITLSMVSCPNLPCSADGTSGALFIALKDQGAYEVSLSDGSVTLLPKLSRQLQGSKMAESFEPAHTSHALSAGLREALHMDPEPFRLDSQCKYGLLARGDASVYLRKPRDWYAEKIWDHAPGLLLVAETGGQVTDFEGKPVEAMPSKYLILTGGILATMLPASDHMKVLEYLKNA